MTNQMKSLGEAIARDDAREMERLAHACAGAGATCGVTGIMEPLHLLETRGKLRRLDGTAEIFAKAHAEFEKAAKYLNNFIQLRLDSVK